MKPSTANIKLFSSYKYFGFFATLFSNAKVMPKSKRGGKMYEIRGFSRMKKKEDHWFFWIFGILTRKAFHCFEKKCKKA